MHIVEKYARDVVYGQLNKQCCKWEILACKRHLNDLERQGTEMFPFIFDESRADRIFRWFSLCRHRMGAFAGQPITLLDWQMFDFGSIFGWVHKDSGKRRFKTGYIRIARGHAKSTCLSAIADYGLCGDALYAPDKQNEAVFESAPEVVCVAVDRGQAKIVWQDALDMAKNSPEISKHVITKKHSITHKKRGGGIYALSKDSGNKDGGRPCLIIIDEYHAHATSEIRDTVKNGKGKRAQSLEFIITTAGTDAENKPCYKEDALVKRILEGEGIEDYFGIIREIDDDDDPHDEKCWVKANPMFRNMDEYSQTLYEEVKSEHDTAYAANDPSKIRAFLIKRMNRWQTDSENKYMSGIMDKLKACKVSKEVFAQITHSQRCFIGLDLGKTTDLSGSAAVFTLPNGKIAVKVHGFMPQNRAIEHEHSDRVEYTHWAKGGYVTLTPGSVTDTNYVENWIYTTQKEYSWNVAECDYDGHNALDLAIRLQENYGEDNVVEIPQSCASLNYATKKFRELVLSGDLIYEESPLFEWCLSNAYEVINNFGDIKLSKKHKDDSQRIDPVAAMMNALTRALVCEPDLTKYIMSDEWGL